MLDIKFVRENPDAIDTAMANRRTSWDREKFFELDDERRAVITEVEELQATRNAESKKIVCRSSSAAPSTAAHVILIPILRRSRANSIIKMAFFANRPINMINAICI